MTPEEFERCRLAGVRWTRIGITLCALAFVQGLLAALAYANGVSGLNIYVTAWAGTAALLGVAGVQVWCIRKRLVEHIDDARQHEGGDDA